jgi:hypothetical protein
LLGIDDRQPTESQYRRCQNRNNGRGYGNENYFRRSRRLFPPSPSPRRRRFAFPLGSIC